MLPYISVVIVDYDRKRYLRSAVESVLNQTLDRAFFEIFVIKNYNSDIDNWLNEEGVTCIYSKEKSYGRKISNIANMLNGDVVVLLDDDDVFASNKLSFIYDVFTNLPALGFFHNYYSKIDEEGTNYSGRRWYFEKLRDFDLICRSNEFKKLAKVMYLGGDFNHSSISFRKILLNNSTGFIERLSGSFDTFIFFLSALSGFDLMFSSKRLTSYRLHDSMSSTSVDTKTRYNYLSKQFRNYSIIYEMVKSSNNNHLSNLVINKIKDTEISQFLLEKHKRRHLISPFIQFIATSSHVSIYIMVRFAIASLYMLSPKICLLLVKDKI